MYRYLLFLWSSSALAGGIVQGGIPPASASITENSITASSITVNGNGSKCFSVDDPTLVVDCQNHRVGIGDTSPNNELDILSNVGPTARVVGVSSNTDVNEGDLLSIMGNGNIGLGTQLAPQFKVQMDSGTFFIQGSGAQIRILTPSTTGILLMTPTNTASPFAPIIWENGFGTTLVNPIAQIDAGIGAGGNSPSMRLQVSNSASSSGILNEVVHLTSVTVGVNITNPLTSLHVGGSITQSLAATISCATGVQTNSTGTFISCVASDVTLKKDVRSLRYDGATIDLLRPVTYRWKDPASRGAGEKTGFIAQDVEKVFPDAVVSAGAGLKGLDSNALIALLVQEVQMLRLRLKIEDAQIENLRDDVFVINGRLDLKK